MKICWDNLERVRFTSAGTFKKGSNTYIEKDKCKRCSESYLTLKSKPIAYCGLSCSMRGENHHTYGKKLSEKHKEKLSKSLKGKNNPMYGVNHTHKTKIKMSKLKKGMYLKEDNPNWKGGISCEPYCFEWSFKEFKDYIKERDGNQCLNPDCFGNIYQLVVHHINYNKKNCEPANLIALCRSCNSRANKDREWHEDWYKAIIYKRYRMG